MVKKFLRFCSVILTLVMLINMLPMQSFAEDFRESLSETQPSTADTADAVVVEEVTANRTQYSKEFLLSNGLHMAAVYPEAVHYEQDGQWAEIDNTLKANLNGTYTNTAGVWDVSFPRQLTGSKRISITKDGYTLSFGMAGELRQSSNLETASTLALDGSTAETFAISAAQTVTAQIQQIDIAALKEAAQFEELVSDKLSSRLLYENVYTDTDIQYDLQSNQIKESVILNQYSDTLRGYRYSLDAGDMIPVLAEDGHIDFYDAQQEDIVMVMPAPFLADANGEYNYDVQVQLTGSGSSYTLTYLLPRQWLADSARAWPVVLDPVVTADLSYTNIRDQSVAEYDTYDYTRAINECGYCTVDGIQRFFLKYNTIPSLTSSDVVIGAYIQMYKPVDSPNSAVVQVHKVLGSWQSETLHWSNKPDFDPQIEDYAIVQAAGYYSWDVTDIVRGWYEGANNGMMFKVSDETENTTTENNWKQFYSSDYSAYSDQPALSIVFRNNNGLESYWDYTASSAGRAGTGYVSNFTGNLVWIHNDIGFGGNRMPVSISHVYNANDCITPTDTNNSNDSGGNYFGLGIGWRTNFHQRLYQWSENGSYYVWEDSDGTDHYFIADDEGVIRDEDGLELTLTTNGSGTQKYCITDKYGNASFFDTHGRLTGQQNNQATKSSITVTYNTDSGPQIASITDGVGRVYSFAYTNGLLTRISYKGTGTSEISYVTFGYSGDLLTSVTDKDGKSAAYTYNSNNLLTCAQDIDGYKLTYSYSTVSAAYQPYRVIKVVESDGDAAGGELNMEYAHNQTTFTDHSGNVQIMQFNDFGNTVSIQDGEGRAQFAQYAFNTDAQAQDSTDATEKGNQLRLSSKLQNTVASLLRGNSFEAGSLWSNTTTTGISHSATTETAYYGSKSIKLVRTDSGGYSGVTTGNLTIPAGTTCTFSAYVKTGSGASAVIALSDGGHTEYSQTLGADKDWTRLQVSYTNTSTGTKYVTCRLLTETAGTVYMDCVQAECSPTASRYNLVDNGDFCYTGSPAYSWTSSGLASTDTRVTVSASATSQLTTNTFRIIGSPTAQKRLTQTVNVSGSEGDTFVLSGWAKGDSAPLDSLNESETTTRQFAVTGTFNYTDGTTKEFAAQFNPDVDSSVNWQYSAEVMVAEKAYSSITVRLAYDYNVNTVYFDGIQLYKEEFGSSYTYDEDGNVKSVKDLQGQTTTYEYNTSGDLYQIIQDNKAKMTYTYDDHHNVITATSEEGLVYNFTYDAYGNNTAVSIGSGSTKITSTAAYTTDGNRLASTTDAAGKTTTYGYNANTNVLEWVQYPEDTEATRTEYTYDSMYRLASAACETDIGNSLSASYTYTDDYLTKIQTPSTTYNFTYGDFGLRTGVSVGNRTLATYNYTAETENDRKYDLDSLDYGNGDSVEYEYDEKGRVIKETFMDGETETGTVIYSYDNDGALARVTDSETGITTTYYYDFTNRMMKYVEIGADYSHSVGYEYDTLNNLTQLVETINGVEHTTSYTYDDDNRIDTLTYGDAAKLYSYDTLGRITQQLTTYGTNALVDEPHQIILNQYTYTSPAEGDTSSQVATHTITTNTRQYIFTYTYDDNGNITGIRKETYVGRERTSDILTTYVYDSANQLIRENNVGQNYTYTWTYDDAGNILSRTEYAYTAGSLSDVTPVDTVTYTYGDSQWGDLLTAYDGQTITYDGIGNPLTDGTWTYTWENGRELASMSDGTTTWSYTYNADGLRTKRTNGTDTYTYVYNGSQLSQMTLGEDTLFFSYDANGIPMTVTWNGVLYHYVTNTRGDVIGLLDTYGAIAVIYSYDAWGNLLEADGPEVDTIGALNPLRYRGYVYDQETGLYYVSSRYYDPEIGRWINADAAIGQIGNVQGTNMFAYCFNNPVNMSDPTGNWPKLSTIFTVVAVAAVAVAAVAVTVATCGAAAPALAVAGGGIIGGISAGAAATAASVATGAMIVAGVSTAAAVTSAVAEKTVEKTAKRNNSVYVLKDDTGTVQYVGRTNNVDKRRAAHSANPARAGLEMEVIASGLNLPESRALEQAGMAYYHTINTANKMNNQINSVSPKYWGAFKELALGTLNYGWNQMSNEILYWTGN